MAINMDQIKKLREDTGAGIMDAKKALEESSGDSEKAKKWILDKGVARAEKKSDRETNAGGIYSYIHSGNRVAAMVELMCETDFVAKTDDFSYLAKELSMQVASMNPQDTESFLQDEYIRNPQLKIDTLIKQTSGKVGEKIHLKRFVRWELGQE